MKRICSQTMLTSLAIPGLVVLTLSLGPGAALVTASGRSGKLHITKECSSYTGSAGSFCTITSSNLAAIPVGSKVLYDQAAGIPAGLLDSNVVLDAGNGNRAVGRCTLDGVTNLGICTFSDGIGELAGFTARVNVSPFPNDLVNYHWRGTYSFEEPGKHGDR
jgi:hypothetical protein